MNIDRIVIAHQHERRHLIGFAEFRDKRERLDERRSGLQRPQTSRLDRRPVRHRIGERHAEFDEIGAGRRQSLQDFERSRKVRIAGHDESHQSGAVLAGKFGETCVDAGGHREGLA